MADPLRLAFLFFLKNWCCVLRARWTISSILFTNGEKADLVYQCWLIIVGLSERVLLQFTKHKLRSDMLVMNNYTCIYFWRKFSVCILLNKYIYCHLNVFAYCSDSIYRTKFCKSTLFFWEISFVLMSMT